MLTKLSTSTPVFIDSRAVTQRIIPLVLLCAVVPTRTRDKLDDMSWQYWALRTTAHTAKDYRDFWSSLEESRVKTVVSSGRPHVTRVLIKTPFIGSPASGKGRVEKMCP